VWGEELRPLTVGLVFTITLVAFETLAVITIMPVVSESLDGVALYGWATSAFFLGMVVGIIVVGGATDRVGPAPPFVAALGLFSAGLCLSASTPSMEVLVAGRALQGLGGGAIPAIAFTAVGRAYPESLRPRVFAIMSTAWVVPGLGGPAVAAVVADHVGWRWVFGGLVPVVVIAGSMTVGALRDLGRPPASEPPASDNAAPTRSRALSLVAALRVSAGAGLVLAGLTSLAPYGIGLAAAGLAVGVGPLRRLLSAGTLRTRRGVPAAVASRGLLTFAFFGADTFVPLAVTAHRGASTTVAGVAVSAATVCWTSGAWTQARLASRRTVRTLVSAGLAIVVVGIAVTATILVRSVPLPLAVAGWGLTGFGMGLAYSPIMTFALSEAPPDRQGAATVAVQLADNLGIAFGAGVGGAAVAASVAGTGSVSTGISIAFGAAASVGAVGFAVARRLPARTLAPKVAEKAEESAGPRRRWAVGRWAVGRRRRKLA
jgi:MFS family permease